MIGINKTMKGGKGLRFSKLNNNNIRIKLNRNNSVLRKVKMTRLFVYSK
jgi:hypothetical protein